MNKILINWRTTAAGVAAICLAIGAVASDVSRVSNILDLVTLLGNPDFQSHVAALVAGVGFLFTKDHNVTGGTIQQ